MTDLTVREGCVPVSQGRAGYRRLPYIVFFLLIAGSVYATASDHAAANKVFVETGQLLKKAAVAKPTEAIKLYEQALQNLDRIVATYPSSTLAVQIVSGQTIGKISRTTIEQALRKAQQAARQVECAQHLTVLCVLDEALETALSIKKHWVRSLVLSRIAVTQAKAGDQAAARQTLAAALETTRSDPHSYGIPELDRGWLATGLSRIATAQAEAGNVPAALEMAHSITDSSTRAETLHDIAAAQAEAGNIPAAMETARNIAESGKRAQALWGIATAQVKAGNVPAAFETAHRIESSYHRAWTLSRIAVAQVKAGDRAAARTTFAAALETARSITESSTRAWMLSRIAVTQAKDGEQAAARTTFAAALETARSITESGDHARALEGIAREQAEAGNVPAALETARSITESGASGMALHAVAAAQAEAGNVPAALETARSIVESGEGVRARALHGIAETMAAQLGESGPSSKKAVHFWNP